MARLVYQGAQAARGDRKSTRLNSSHLGISYAVFCLEKKSRRLNSSHYGFSDAGSGLNHPATPRGRSGVASARGRLICPSWPFALFFFFFKRRAPPPSPPFSPSHAFFC